MSTSLGKVAEGIASNYLSNLGFEIIDQNWKTRMCEIDIVAQKDKRIYFVEVKYRKNDSHGTGLEYITSKKLTQMKFAAQMWVADSRWQGEYSLGAIEVGG